MSPPRFWSVKKVSLFFLLAFFFFALILPEKAFRGDINYWRDWMQLLHDNGLMKIYNYRVEYHPVYLYFLWFFQWIMGSMEEVNAHINYVKIFPLVFDFIGALSVFWILKRDFRTIIYPFFLLFNIAYMYNTMIWGQVDAVHTAFVGLSIIAILKSRINLGVLFFLLALNTKLQTIIYLPIFGMLLLPHFVKSSVKLAQSFSVLLIGQLIILIPFMLGGSVSGLWRVVVGAEGLHPHVSMNAYNMWYYFIDTNPAKIVDKTIFAMGVSYKTWGRILFFLFSFIALLPLLKGMYKSIKNRIVPGEDFLAKVFLTAGLITIIFFYFNTQMHERYSHPAILFFFFYGIRTGRYMLYIVCSIAYFLNMEDVLMAFDFQNYLIVPFDPRFIASLYLLIILWSISRLYYFDRKKIEVN